MNYELQGVKPFNVVYYVDCYYLAIFTVVKYLKGSVFSFIANDYFYYQLEETPGQMTINLLKSDLPVNDIYESNGINVELEYDYCQDIVGFIKDSLLNNKIIVLPIDGFYYKHPFHDLFYQKEHHNNMMVIYGFDDDKRIFKTTETNGFQWNTKDCHYKHQISYEDLKMGHKGVVNYLQSNPPHPIILQFSKDDCSKKIIDTPSFYKNKMIDNLKAHEKDIFDGLNNISILADNVNHLKMSETNSFNNLVAAVSNRYAIKNILGVDEQYMKLSNKIVQMWRTIRSILYKFEYQGIGYDKDVFNSRFKRLYELEKSSYEYLFTWMKSI